LAGVRLALDDEAGEQALGGDGGDFDPGAETDAVLADALEQADSFGPGAIRVAAVHGGERRVGVDRARQGPVFQEEQSQGGEPVAGRGAAHGQFLTTGG
jgi:hypothetical protein